MRRKLANRKPDVGALSDYVRDCTPIVTKVTSAQIARAIRNLAPGTAPGPEGLHSSTLLKITRKAQNVEIGAKFTEELARFAISLAPPGPLLRKTDSSIFVFFGNKPDMTWTVRRKGPFSSTKVRLSGAASVFFLA